MNHDTYKKLKRKNKAQLEEWVSWFGFFNYSSGLKDAEASIFLKLVDEFGFTDEQIAKLKALTRGDIEAINEQYITAREIINGLIDEGYESLKGET